MSEETAFRAVDYMLKQSPLQKKFLVYFFGGEPLMNFPLIEKVIEYCEEVCKFKNIEIKYGMATNGTILNDRILECIKKHHIKVTVSIDGPKEIHDKYRKFRNDKGTFEVITENVKQISRYIPVFARVTLTKHSPPILEIGRALKEIGIKHMYFATVSDNSSCGNCSDQNINNMGMPINQLLDLEEEIKKISECIIDNERKEKKYSILEKCLYQRMALLKQERYCGCGGRIIAVSANGDIFPCHRFVDMKAFKLGDIWNGLNGECYAKFFNEHDKSKEKCKKCWAVGLCGGGCAHEAVVDGCRFGESDENNCIQFRAQKEGAIYLNMKRREKKMMASQV
jgi:uncharacterized protein